MIGYLCEYRDASVVIDRRSMPMPWQRFYSSQHHFFLCSDP